MTARQLEQGGARKRLVEAFVGHASEERSHVGVRGRARHEHDALGDLRCGGLRGLEELGAGEDGHHHVAEHQIGRLVGVEEALGLARIGDGHDVVLTRQHAAQGVEDGWVVVDEQDAAARAVALAGTVGAAGALGR